MNVNYRANSFNLVANLHVHLKGRMTYCVDYHFNETIFLSLGRVKLVLEKRHEIICTLTYLDPHTNQCELEIQKMIYLQGLANQLPTIFINAKKLTKSISLT